LICPPCRTGGQLAASARGLDRDIAYRMLEDARTWHTRCAYPENCPCRHHVGVQVVAKDTQVPK
jgi:hypothetical protein